MSSRLILLIFNLAAVLMLSEVGLQCFDTVGWASGRASGLWKM